MRLLIAIQGAAVMLLSAYLQPSIVHGQPQQAPQLLDDACWSISFEDHFEQLSLWDDSLAQSDAAQGVWRTQYIWPRDVIINDEMQFYIDPALHEISPFYINNGVLSITAQAAPKHLQADIANQPYVSGVLTSEKSFAQQYGRFEVRAKVPEGQGLWSAFWLLPSFDQWPQGVDVLPEIDVMEHLGHQPNVYHTTLHTNQTGALSSHPYDHTEQESLTKGFHVYSVIWTAESVNWYLDGQWRAAHPTPLDFTRPVHFLLNLAVGGSWPGPPDSSTQFPASFDIDYVRAYTRNSACSKQ